MIAPRLYTDEVKFCRMRHALVLFVGLDFCNGVATSNIVSSNRNRRMHPAASSAPVRHPFVPSPLPPWLACQTIDGDLQLASCILPPLAEGSTHYGSNTGISRRVNVHVGSHKRAICSLLRITSHQVVRAAGVDGKSIELILSVTVSLDRMRISCTNLGEVRRWGFPWVLIFLAVGLFEEFQQAINWTARASGSSFRVSAFSSESDSSPKIFAMNPRNRLSFRYRRKQSSFL